MRGLIIKFVRHFWTANHAKKKKLAKTDLDNCKIPLLYN